MCEGREEKRGPKGRAHWIVQKTELREGMGGINGSGAVGEGSKGGGGVMGEGHSVAGAGKLKRINNRSEVVTPKGTTQQTGPKKPLVASESGKEKEDSKKEGLLFPCCQRSNSRKKELQERGRWEKKPSTKIEEGANGKSKPKL